MSYVIYTTVNENGLIIETVAYNEKTNSIYMYELSENEYLIKEEIPEGLLKPKWDFKLNQWIENATEEELNTKKQEEENRQKELEKQEEMNNLEQNLNKTLLKTISDLQLEVAMLKAQGGK